MVQADFVSGRRLGSIGEDSEAIKMRDCDLVSRQRAR